MKQIMVAMVAGLILLLSGCPITENPDGPHSITIMASGAEGSDEAFASTYSAVSGTQVTLVATLGTERQVTLTADAATVTPETISNSGGTASFTMPESNVVIAAVFSDIFHHLEMVSSGATGVSTVEADVSSAKAGSIVTLTATLETGRKVSLSADGVTFTPDVISTSGDTSSFAMPASDLTIAADFSDILHGITIVPGGAIGTDEVGSSIANAADGTTITLTATLETGRTVTLSSPDVSLSSTVLRNTGETATFAMPDLEVTVSAVFEYFQVGDTGPAGGIVYYDDTIGFDFDNSGTIASSERDLLDGINNGSVTADRFLEAAPANWNGGVDPIPAWGLASTDTSLTNLEDVSGAGLAGTIGNGATNTATLAALGASYAAARLCESYSGGDQMDWFLPSLGELKLIYENKDDIGGLTSLYVSSSEFDADTVWCVVFGDGGWAGTTKEDGAYVRPSRSF